MNYASWRSKILNSPPIDIDNSGDFDCVDVPKDYAISLFPGVRWQDSIGYGNAKDLFIGANPKYFEKIPYRKGLIPKQGYVAVFGATPAPGYTNQYVNPDGHTGVIDSANGSIYTLIQQDSGTGEKPHLATWPWDYRPPIGFLRPIVVNTVKEEVMAMTPAENKVYGVGLKAQKDGWQARLSAYHEALKAQIVAETKHDPVFKAEIQQLLK